ncbi:DUF2909 domain-containing protein [Catenovulum agarivorans]|uniref:DUF2909 domain-containing protein n=1 Tax=Catenovulum agarivorans TaxID=1172192 RepID=UPI0002F8EE01|nr:DUF2909 domain-containing protein [Catenovulum agarivorans]
MLKVIIVVLLFISIFSLFRALMAMSRDDKNQQMTRNLGRRVMFSALTLVLIVLALSMGWIEPNQRPY